MSDDRQRAARLEAKLDLAKELVRVVFVRELDLADVAEAAGVSDSLPSRWGSRKCSDAIGLVDVVLVGRRFPGFAHDLLRWAGERLDLVVARRLSAQSPGAHLAHAAQLAKEAGEAIAAYADGLTGERMSDAQVAALHRELRDLEEATSTLRAWLDGERDGRAITPITKGRAA